MLSSCVRRFSRKSSLVLLSWMLSLVAATFTPLALAVATLPAPDVTVVDYKLVSKTRASFWSWAQYEYVYKIEVRNGGNGAVNRVVGTVTGDWPQMEISDNEVLVGSLQPNQTLVSGDTFTIHAHKFFDRRLDPKTFKNGHWDFEDGGQDPDDRNVPGHDNGSPGQDLDAFYRLKLGHIFRWSFTYTPDAEQPVIANTAPAGLGNQTRPTISASYSDAGSGVDVSGVRLIVDGVNITSTATISSTGIQYQPANALADGEHSVQLNVPDLAGNVAMANWTFTVDATAPQISSVLPVANALVSGAPTISAQYTDGSALSSGVSIADVRLFVDGADVTAGAQVTATKIAYAPSQAWADGSHAVRIVVPDSAGNIGEVSWSFTVDSVLPQVSAITPENDAVLELNALPTIAGSIIETGSGIDPASLVVQLDGQAISAQLNTDQTAFSYALTQPLTEGMHSIVAVVRDRAGNTGSVSWQFKNAQSPVFSDATPYEIMLPGGSTPEIATNISDEGSGIDVGSVHVFLDGEEVTSASEISGSRLSYQVPSPLFDGVHSVLVTVADRAGNTAQSEWRFGTATPPVISNPSPRDAIVIYGSDLKISAQFFDSRVGVDPNSVYMSVNGQNVTAQSMISGNEISYTPPSPLSVGPATVYLEVSNATNGTAALAWGFYVEEVPTYAVEFVAPQSGQVTTSSEFQVRIAASSNKAGIQAAIINGQPAEREFSADGETIHYVKNVKLRDGDNQIVAEVTFSNGEVRRTSTQVMFDTPPRVTITSPVDKSTFGAVSPNSPRDLTGNVERPVLVTGTISKPVQSVTINQQLARLENGGTTFRFDNFFLHEGINLLTAVATDAQGRVSSAAVTVSVDQTAPLVLLENPTSGVLTSNARIDLRGLANDAVEGFSGAPEPTVTVTNVENGQVVHAEVVDRYFLAVGVPLVMGQNRLTVTATDQVGNVRTENVLVSRVAVGSERLTLLSGNYQKGPMHTQLPQPLTVVALNAAGEPLEGLPVSFDITRGTGWITSTSGVVQKPDGVNPARTLVVPTDERGYAKVWLTPGKQSGVGANVVRAWVNVAALPAGSAGRAVSEDVYFLASVERGIPSQILAEMGTNQFAETRSQPLELLSAVVRDEFDNVIPSVPVTFRIEEGDAFFGELGSGTIEKIVITDKNGYVAVRPTIGDRPGRVRVSALIKANPADPASAEIKGCSYLIQARVPVDGPASFSGYVYTDKGDALPGVRVSIGRTVLAVTTDEHGFFRMDNVPPGRIDLFVDGRTSSHKNETWPALHFEVIAIRGVANQLPHPIYLPPLAMAEAKVVGGNEDVILKIPGLDGFQMRVKANSVTFPDGSHVGTLVVSPVTGDRLPMTPPGGATVFGTPAWTIQPAGARFDPPIEVTMPNTRGMRPGETAPVVQWDHDLAQYVPMGHATVSEDAVFLITDIGSGVTKAGWGGTPNFDTNGCAADGPPTCGECEKVVWGLGACPTGSCAADMDKSTGDVVLGPPNYPLPVRSAFSAETAAKGFTERLKKFRDPRVDVGVKAYGQFSLLTDYRCCYSATGGASKHRVLTGSGGVEVEVKFAWPSTVMLDTLQKIAPKEIGEIAEANITSKLKGTFALGASALYFKCKDPKVQGDITAVTALTFDAIGIEAKLPIPVGKYREVALSGSVGVTGGYKYTFVDMDEMDLIFLREGVAYAYIKADVKFVYRTEDGALSEPTHKVTIADFIVPLGESSGYESVTLTD